MQVRTAELALGRRPVVCLTKRSLLRVIAVGDGGRARKLWTHSTSAVEAETAEVRDRSSEASTSRPVNDPQSALKAAARKAKRIEPTALNPGPIEDINVLENGVILVDKPVGWTRLVDAVRNPGAVKLTSSPRSNNLYSTHPQPPL
jgi:hypothetical protein